MIHSYSELYLSDAMVTLAEAFDYAVNDAGLSLSEFMDRFISSGISAGFERGSPRFVCGLSGIELVMMAMEKSGWSEEFPKPGPHYEASPEYWCGHILAYYQWRSGLSFRDIRDYIGMDRLLALYPTMHEASEERAMDALNSIFRQNKPKSKLQSLRKLWGFSQSELSEKSGVNLRTLQQYESGAKDINKAAGKTLLALSKCLRCRIEDLLEPDIGSFI